jgi:hypothetical protein
MGRGAEAGHLLTKFSLAWPAAVWRIGFSRWLPVYLCVSNFQREYIRLVGTEFVIFRQLGFYAAKILYGTKSADLPVEQAVKFELVVNLKTAKAVGFELSAAIQLRADEVIE